MLIGSLTASPLKRFSLANLSIGGFIFGGVMWLAAVAVGWFPATLGLFFLAWIPVGATNVIFAAMIQSVVPEHLMGRVSSVLSSASVGAMPLGSLLGGIGWRRLQERHRHDDYRVRVSAHRTLLVGSSATSYCCKLRRLG